MSRYELSKKYKWFDWIDDHILWYIWDTPRSWYSSLRHWFKCNWNIYHWNTVKCAVTGYPWDGSFIWALEECKINEAYHWFEHHQMMVDEQYNELMRSLRWAKSLIHIIVTEADEYWHSSGNIETIENPDKVTYTIKTDNWHYQYTGPQVNMRNANRFFTPQQVEHINQWHTHDIYLVKAKHLYSLIRERYTDMWWD